MVQTRYFNSNYLGKAAASNVLEKLKNCMSGLDENKLLQVSMDGPNVNKSVIMEHVDFIPPIVPLSMGKCLRMANKEIVELNIQNIQNIR